MITPVDIQNKVFKSSFRGYSADEVDEFLEELFKDYSRMYRENADLKDKNAILKDAVDTYKEMEETMRSAIISAQRTSEEIIKNAHEQADNIVNDAKVQAKEILNKAEEQVVGKRRILADVEAKISLLRARLSAVLNSHMQMLNELPEEEPEATRVMEPVQTEE